jgi:hypothetical protein
MPKSSRGSTSRASWMGTATRRAVRAGRSAPRLVVALKPGADAGLLRDITDRYARFGGWPPVPVAVSA